MRFRLRTLLILMAICPVYLAFAWNPARFEDFGSALSKLAGALPMLTALAALPWFFSFAAEAALYSLRHPDNRK